MPASITEVYGNDFNRGQYETGRAPTSGVQSILNQDFKPVGNTHNSYHQWNTRSQFYPSGNTQYQVPGRTSEPEIRTNHHKHRHHFPTNDTDSYSTQSSDISSTSTIDTNRQPVQHVQQPRQQKGAGQKTVSFDTPFIGSEVNTTNDTLQTRDNHICGSRVYEILSCPGCLKVAQENQLGGNNNGQRQGTLINGLVLGVAAILALDMLSR